MLKLPHLTDSLTVFNNLLRVVALHEALHIKNYTHIWGHRVYGALKLFIFIVQ